MARHGAELREKALAVLARFRDLREAGSGSLPMEEMLALLGAPEDPTLRARIEARGAIHVQFDGDGPGSFRNVGPAFTTPLGPGKLVVPGEIAGRVTWQDGAVSLDFDPQRTMLGKVLFLEVRLERVEVSERHVAVRFPGGVFDQEYSF